MFLVKELCNYSIEFRLEVELVMNWTGWALVTAGLYALFDFCVKKTSGKVEDGLAGLIFNVVAALVAAIFLFMEKQSGVKFFAAKEGLIFNVLGGIFVGLTTVTFIKMFSSG